MIKKKEENKILPNCKVTLILNEYIDSYIETIKLSNVSNLFFSYQFVSPSLLNNLNIEIG